MYTFQFYNLFSNESNVISRKDYVDIAWKIQTRVIVERIFLVACLSQRQETRDRHTRFVSV